MVPGKGVGNVSPISNDIYGSNGSNMKVFSTVKRNFGKKCSGRIHQVPPESLVVEVENEGNLFQSSGKAIYL